MVSAPLARLIVPADLGTPTLQRWIDAIARADGRGWPMILLAASNVSDPLDGLAIAAWCASRTRRIALCVSIDPDTVEPFTLARGIATLDHLSGGRAAWRLAGDGRPDGDRAAELAHVVENLLASWGADALLEDAAAGLLSDHDAVHPIAHGGAFFSVRGPLNVPRPPQGVPPRIALPGDPASEGAEAVSADRMMRLTIDQAMELLA